MLVATLQSLGGLVCLLLLLLFVLLGFVPGFDLLKPLIQSNVIQDATQTMIR